MIVVQSAHLAVKGETKLLVFQPIFSLSIGFPIFVPAEREVTSHRFRVDGQPDLAYDQQEGIALPPNYIFTFGIHLHTSSPIVICAPHVRFFRQPTLLCRLLLLRRRRRRRRRQVHSEALHLLHLLQEIYRLGHLNHKRKAG